MAITIDGSTKRIILDSSSVTAAEIWTAWVDWHPDNSQWPLAFTLVGGIALGGDLFIPPYFFLLNSWRVRPMEEDHTLTITGNLFVEGGGVPVVRTLGTYQVNVNYTVPVQAQGISTSGGTGPTASAIAAEVRAELSDELAIIEYLHKIVKNKRAITADKKLAVYDDDDTTPILEKQLADKDGLAIADLASGVLAQEGKSII